MCYILDSEALFQKVGLSWVKRMNGQVGQVGLSINLLHTKLWGAVARYNFKGVNI